ncbi:aminodeoxychorismate synthase, component I [Dethiobacter alkaliphilus]|uniref:aminodeoxychorismate synthase, component I n=1 Tax=Dethiobacter alkaliphilus TaxID=427926 RepID=UPI002227095F|nr:aminodeoxychorismate synthase, component I [Dethiobacter alkaliphilus]MCW3490512.1 aminodeoxychorismate synthase, component I [Dethiobacter alkaliphilus]
MRKLKPQVAEITLDRHLDEVFAPFTEEAYPFWLDSSKPGGQMGRWSFMGSNPFLVLKTYGRRIILEENGATREFDANPFEVLREQLKRFTLERGDLPFPFIGGAVGFFSYDLGRMVENLPDDTVNDLNTPDIYLGFYSTVIAIDHEENRNYIIASGLPLEGEEAYNKAMDDMAAIKQKISGPVILDDPWAEQDITAGEIRTFFTPDTYGQAVERIRDYITAGDIYQANMTQRFDAPLKMPPYQLYRRLRQANPAPFAAYLDCGDNFRVFSSSPERYLLLEDNVVETRPIKGTLPRGKTPEEDQQNAEALLKSEKDRAELVMIIDLERNDLGRVCSYGSVHVPELIVLEKYTTVFHLVSTVRGELAPGKDFVDLLKASFPGGSITGAPKIRAMEIIEELEPVRRGVYTGSIGYVGFDGRADLNIVIRTFINKNDKVHLQAGGGIVFDSQPYPEYQETLHKAKALLKSLGVNQFPEVQK